MNQPLFQLWIEGIKLSVEPTSLFYMTIGTFLGVMVGAIPGFTSTMAVGILLPITFFLSPIHSMVFLVSIYVAAIYGGSITAILINTPGTPESSVTTLDGYTMTQKGQASEALGTAFGSSCIGGLISYFLMAFFMVPIANFALRFGPSEMFLLALFGISILASIGQKDSMFKTLIAGAFGLLIGTVGIVPTGEWRATFNSIYLAEGVQMIPVIIGLFAFSELLSMLSRPHVVEGSEPEARDLRMIIKGLRTPLKYKRTLLRSTVIGTIIGAIPAAGGTIAAVTAYGEAKRNSHQPDTFGSGNPEGIVAAEVANNACTGGALMTSLALGVPGSSTCAVLLGALMLQGLRPGPQLVTSQLNLVYGIIMAAIVSQALMLAMSVFAGYMSVGILNLNTRYLVPIITVFCVTGTFAIRNALFDVVVMVIFGVLGYVLKQYGYPPVAVVLGFVLGPIADSELIRTFMLYGEKWYLSFVTRPISLAMLSIIIIILTRQIIKEVRNSKVECGDRV